MLDWQHRCSPREGRGEGEARASPAEPADAAVEVEVVVVLGVVVGPEHDVLARTSFTPQAELKIQGGIVQTHDDVGSQPREECQPDRDSYAQPDAEWKYGS